MPKAKKKKSADKKGKSRNKKYEQKLQINGSFEDLLKELSTPKEQIKKAG